MISLQGLIAAASEVEGLPCCRKARKFDAGVGAEVEPHLVGFALESEDATLKDKFS